MSTDASLDGSQSNDLRDKFTAQVNDLRWDDFTTHADFISDVGEQLLVEPLSVWSRKLQVILLLLATVTILLSWGVIEVHDANVEAVQVALLQPKYAPRLAACITLYVLLMYIHSCYHDFALNQAQRARAAAKGFARLGHIALRQSQLQVTRAMLRKESLADELEHNRTFRELCALEAEFWSGTMPSYKQARLEELRQRHHPTERAKVASRHDEQSHAIDEEESRLDATGQDLVALFKTHRTHLLIRTWVEVVGPTGLALLASVIGWLSPALVTSVSSASLLW